MPNQKLGFFENFMLSGVAAGVAKTGSAPIERVKLLVQNQDEMIKQGILEKRYNGVGDCFARTMKTEGLTSFWRGNTANVIRYFPTQALNFAFKDQIKAIFKSSPNEGYATKFTKNIASGGAAGALSLCFVYSLDYARTRMANDTKSSKKGGERQFNGLIDVYRKTIATDGVAGLYRGFVISCVGIVAYRGAYFGLYDTLKPMMIGENGSFIASFCLGYAVTVVSGIVSYPLDTIRRRMMMTSGAAVKYNGSLDCARQVIKAEGFMSLMKGAGANVARGAAGALVLSGFDLVKEFYIKLRLSA